MSKFLFGIQWRTMLRESLAVLAAILIAFGLDAWWEGYRERQDSLEALATTEAEMRSNIDQIDEVIENNRVGIEHLGNLVNASPAVFDTMSSVTIQGSYSQFGSVLTVTPEFGALTALVDGGFLSALESPELRSALAGLGGAWEEATEEGEIIELNGWDVSTGTFSAVGPEAMLIFSGQAPLDSQRQGFRRIVESREALAHWSTMWAFSQIYQGELQEMRAHLSEVMAMVEAERRR